MGCRRIAMGSAEDNEEAERLFLHGGFWVIGGFVEAIEEHRNAIRREVLDDLFEVKGIADIFKADEQKGLLGDDDDLLKRRNAFGSNTYPRKKGWSFWNFVWDAFYDITLLILIIAAAASLCLGVKSEMPPGQAKKRRSTTSMLEANMVEVPAHMSTAPSPMDASASLSPVDASPSLPTVDIDIVLVWFSVSSTGVFKAQLLGIGGYFLISLALD
ncbi:Calcium-transporting ATPase 10, plasma membrane-type [Camellia lanceoleosa]|uniref:Calcium-transporting ATPase 10, plasma membrane-type n=1 Tax=Camellia lanceoleosa TaxID=1840588 RepID=A0ACC0HCB7_9ERIC|nr:Calcium-transporting ATPase 10, plasma membrane-type [Camellia lanceoleosa]